MTVPSNSHGKERRKSADECSLVSGEIRCMVGEGPLWAGDENSLYWVDILAPAIYRLSIADGSLNRWSIPENIGWIIPRREHHGFIAGLRTGFAEIDLAPFAVRHFARIPEHLVNQRLRLNDAKACVNGRVFAGSMDMDGKHPGHLYRLDPDRSFTVVDSGYGIANGPTFSPAGDVLYHSDTMRRIVYQIDLSPDGALANKRTFVEFPEEWGVPDGMTTDAEGGVWIAHWGGSRVSRFTPDGALDRAAYLPVSQVTSCVFAGPDLGRMFVTTAALGKPEEPLAGAVFEIDPRCKGVPAHPFAG